MRTHIKLLGRLKLLIASGWTASVFAAEPTIQLVLKLPNDITPWALVAIAIFLAAWGGASFTVQRWARGEDNTRWKQYLVRDIFCAQTAGAISFLVCIWLKVDPPLAAIIVLIAGYGGSRVIDKYLNAFESAIDKKADALTGPKPS